MKRIIGMAAATTSPTHGVCAFVSFAKTVGMTPSLAMPNATRLHALSCDCTTAISDEITARLTNVSHGCGRTMAAEYASRLPELATRSLLEARPCTPQIRNMNQTVQ